MKFIKTFQQEGFSLRVEALKVLKNVLAQQPDEQTRKDLIRTIIDDLKVTSTSKTTLHIVTKESLDNTLQNIWREQTKADDEDAIEVIDAFEFPAIQFNSSKNTYERVPQTDKVLHAPANKKIHIMRNRLEAIHRRLLRDPIFQVDESFLQENDSIKLTTIEELVGSKSSQSVLGILSRIDDEFLYLEDLSGYVKLKIIQNMPDEDKNTFITPGIYSEGMVVLVQGEMKSGVFEASLVGQPKVESRESFLRNYPSFQRKLEVEMPKSANLVVLSDVWLDQKTVKQKLWTLFEGYCSNRFLPEVFVLIGNFHSVPLDSLGTNTTSYMKGFEALADIIQSFPLLQEHSRIILVPGPNDPFDSGILPRRAIASHFTKALQKLPNVQFATNPCKINFYSQEIVVFREDMLPKLQRLTVVDNTFPKEEIYETYAQSILSQGHLSPVPLQLNPVYWNFDYTLQLDVLPDLLILADSCDQYLVEHEECRVINPASFTQGYSFASYSPGEDELSFSIIGDTYEEFDDSEEEINGDIEEGEEDDEEGDDDKGDTSLEEIEEEDKLEEPEESTVDEDSESDIMKD